MMLLSGSQAPDISHSDVFKGWESIYLGILSALSKFIFQHFYPPSGPRHPTSSMGLFDSLCYMMIVIHYMFLKPTLHDASVNK